jgi:hypothetical protein
MKAGEHYLYVLSRSLRTNYFVVAIYYRIENLFICLNVSPAR